MVIFKIYFIHFFIPIIYVLTFKEKSVHHLSLKHKHLFKISIKLLIQTLIHVCTQRLCSNPLASMIIDIINGFTGMLYDIWTSPGAPNVIITLKFCIQCQRNKWSILTAPNCCCQRPSQQVPIKHWSITHSSLLNKLTGSLLN